MPCLDGREHEDRADQDHMARGGELLCRILKTTPPRLLELLSPDIQRWWAEHQERDKRREERGW